METTDTGGVAKRVIEHADDLVRDSVRALMGVRRLNIAQLAALLDMHPETLRKKLNAWGSQRAFSGGEIVRLAQVFNVEVMDLHRGAVIQVPAAAFARPLQPQDPRAAGVLWGADPQSTPGYDWEVTCVTPAWTCGAAAA